MTVEVGTFDEIHTIIGVRGSGKSTFAMELALDIGWRDAPIMIGHSPGARLPTRLPDGRATGIVWVDTMRAMQRQLRRDTESIPILVDPDFDPMELVEYGSALSESIIKREVERGGEKYRANRPLPEGLRATPVLMIIDEGVLIREPAGRKASPEWELFLTGARHANVGLIWGTQRPTARNWIMLEQSTQAHLFHYTHEYGLNALRAAGVPKHVALEEVPRLAKFEHRTYDRWELTAGRDQGDSD